MSCSCWSSVHETDTVCEVVPKVLIKFAERVSIENISRLLVELRFAALKLKGT